MKITVEKTEKQKVELEIELPYFTKWNDSVFYKVYGTNYNDCLRVSETAIATTSTQNAFDNSVVCSEDEFNESFLKTQNTLLTQFNK